jgi:hypothetical protein
MTTLIPKYDQSSTGAVNRPINQKLAEIVSIQDFGAIGNGTTDNTTAFTALSTWVNSQTSTGKPIGIYFPQGTYLYSSGLDFQNPVAIYSDYMATLSYTGTGNAINLGSTSSTISSYPYDNAEYSVSGLRITSTNTAVHGIFIRPYVISPRISNVVFEDFGSGVGGNNYCIFGYDNVWDAVFENIRMYTLNRTDANANFICLTGVSSGGVSDGGNSRMTMSNCFMAAFNNINLGIYAYVSGTASRILGGSFVNSSYGIFLSPDAQDVIISDVYSEMASNALAYITTSSKTVSGNLYAPSGVTVNNAYINFHNHNIPMIKCFDANVIFENWTINHVKYGNIVNNQLMIQQNDIGNQFNNIASDFIPIFVPEGSDNGYRVQITNPNLSTAESWGSPSKVFNIEVVGTSTYTLQQQDAGKIKRLTGASAVVTIPSSLTNPDVPIGTVIYFHNETGGTQTIVPASGVTLSLSGSSGSGTRTIAANGLARIVCLQSNIWIADGNGVS